LMPPGMEDVHTASQVHTVDSTFKAQTWQVTDKSTLERIRRDLSGLFTQEDLKRLETGAYLAQALYMISFWLWQIDPDGISAEGALQQEIRQLRLTELCSMSQKLLSTAPARVEIWALAAMRFCRLRVDENNNSTCAGTRTLGAQFLFSSIQPSGIVRLWFRKPQTADTDNAFSMDLSGEEWPELHHRICFPNATNQPSLDRWRSIEGATKVLTQRAVYRRGNSSPSTLRAITPRPLVLLDSEFCHIPS
jgi:hypothetical protein